MLGITFMHVDQKATGFPLLAELQHPCTLQTFNNIYKKVLLDLNRGQLYYFECAVLK